MQEAMNMSFNDITYFGDIMNNPTRTCSDEEIVEAFNNIKDVVTVIKSVLKVITKETLKKAVPGIGLGIILVETVHCSLT